MDYKLLKGRNQMLYLFVSYIAPRIAALCTAWSTCGSYKRVKIKASINLESVKTELELKSTFDKFISLDVSQSNNVKELTKQKFKILKRYFSCTLMSFKKYLYSYKHSQANAKISHLFTETKSSLMTSLITIWMNFVSLSRTFVCTSKTQDKSQSWKGP